MSWVMAAVAVGAGVTKYATTRSANSAIDKAASPMDRWGKNQFENGSKLTEEGLGGLRGLDSTFSDQLANGGLTPELQRQFSVANGRLTDQYVRSGRSLKAALEQRRLQSQGQLSPGAIAELEKENEIESTENYFDSSNQLAGEKAMLTFNSTKDLFDRITNIRDTIRTTGLTREQQGTLARLSAAAMKAKKGNAFAEGLGTAAGTYLTGMGKGQ